MLIAIFVAWVMFSSYCVVCIFVPEMRLLRWLGSGAKLGTLSHVCVAWFFGGPLLIVIGVIPPEYSFFMYLTMILAMLILFIGGYIDRENDLSSRRRGKSR